MTTIIRNGLCFYTVTEYDYIDEYKMDIIGVAKSRPPTGFIPMGLTGIPRKITKGRRMRSSWFKQGQEHEWNMQGEQIKGQGACYDKGCPSETHLKIKS